MCIAMPLRITEIRGFGPLAMATAEGPMGPEEFSLAYVQDAQVGNFVMIQAGFAQWLVSDEEAQESLAAFAELGVPTGIPHPDAVDGAGK